MFDFIEWYIPWSHLDLPLKVMAVIWVLTTLLGACIFVYTALLKRPWLSMRHLQLPSENADKPGNS